MEMTVNWEALATVAEIIGAIGVIASLLYVARQVKSAQTTAADTNRQSKNAPLRGIFTLGMGALLNRE